jgi:hypothetical protein
VVHLIAYLIFAALAAAAWFVSVALYRSTVGRPDPVAAPNFRAVSIVTIGAVALTSFAPMPLGYALGLVVWAVAAFGFVGLPGGPAAVLFAFLAAGSYVTRLVTLGVLDLTK